MIALTDERLAAKMRDEQETAVREAVVGAMVDGLLALVRWAAAGGTPACCERHPISKLPCLAARADHKGPHRDAEDRRWEQGESARDLFDAEAAGEREGRTGGMKLQPFTSAGRGGAWLRGFARGAAVLARAADIADRRQDEVLERRLFGDGRVVGERERRRKR